MQQCTLYMTLASRDDFFFSSSGQAVFRLVP